MKCSIPAARASSTTCCTTGRSTTHSISLGTALVAGRNRVPRPATGRTALRMRFIEGAMSEQNMGRGNLSQDGEKETDHCQASAPYNAVHPFLFHRRSFFIEARDLN